MGQGIYDQRAEDCNRHGGKLNWAIYSMASTSIIVHAMFTEYLIVGPLVRANTI